MFGPKRKTEGRLWLWCQGVKDGAWSARCVKSQTGTTWKRVLKACAFFFFNCICYSHFHWVYCGQVRGCIFKMLFLSQKDSSPLPLKKKKKQVLKNIFIYLAVLVLVTELGIFDHCLRGTLSCGMRGLVSWPGLKLRPLHGAWSLSHWTTGEVPSSICICVNFVSLRGFEFPTCI